MLFRAGNYKWCMLVIRPFFKTTIFVRRVFTLTKRTVGQESMQDSYIPLGKFVFSMGSQKGTVAYFSIDSVPRGSAP